MSGARCRPHARTQRPGRPGTVPGFDSSRVFIMQFGGGGKFIRGGLFGFSPDLESTRMWDASLENAKQPPFGICDIRSIWLQVPSFPRARPRMCRREDWVAALNLIEARSHTLSSFRRIKF